MSEKLKPRLTPTRRRALEQHARNALAAALTVANALADMATEAAPERRNRPREWLALMGLHGLAVEACQYARQAVAMFDDVEE